MKTTDIFRAMFDCTYKDSLIPLIEYIDQNPNWYNETINKEDTLYNPFEYCKCYITWFKIPSLKHKCTIILNYLNKEKLKTFLRNNQ